MNRDLGELEQIMEDIQRAKRANVPDIDEMERKCHHCQESIRELKREYFPGKP
jgi:hypothetical protein